MLLHFGANPKTSLTQIPCSSNYTINCHNCIITHLNLRKTHNSHTLFSPTSIWKVMIINDNKNNNGSKCGAFGGIGVLAAAAVLSTPPPTEETLSNIPQTLSTSKSCDYGSNSVECEDMKVKRIQKPKSRNAERCTSKCATTCARGGYGSPGEGPLTLRGLVECSDICNLLDDAAKARKLNEDSGGF
ncbi:hypothetical protein KSS87_013340 [Heliosperma pusillum]|nr:hypothetical protein KSS87_013340 [Heliosperma pusillum]